MHRCMYTFRERERERERGRERERRRVARRHLEFTHLTERDLPSLSHTGGVGGGEASTGGDPLSRVCVRACMCAGVRVRESE